MAPRFCTLAGNRMIPFLSFVRRGVRFLSIYIILISSFVSAVLNSNISEIDTPVGKIYGLVDDITPRVAQYLGIPFAEPPVGPLRWLPARPKAPVAAIDATAFGPSCAQYWTSLPQVYNTDVRGFLVNGPTSEDCLTLNIWAPTSQKLRPLPVIVWLYGGSFQTGGGNTPYQIPSQWVERSQNHIVVGIKYVSQPLTSPLH